MYEVSWYLLMVFQATLPASHTAFRCTTCRTATQRQHCTHRVPPAEADEHTRTNTCGPAHASHTCLSHICRTALSYDHTAPTCASSRCLRLTIMPRRSISVSSSPVCVGAVCWSSTEGREGSCGRRGTAVHGRKRAQARTRAFVCQASWPAVELDRAGAGRDTRAQPGCERSVACMRLVTVSYRTAHNPPKSGPHLTT